LGNRNANGIWEFLHTRDLADAIPFSLKNTTRRQLLMWAAATTSQSGSWRAGCQSGWDRRGAGFRYVKPTAPPRELLDISRLRQLGGNQGTAWKMEFGIPLGWQPRITNRDIRDAKYRWNKGASCGLPLASIVQNWVSSRETAAMLGTRKGNYGSWMQSFGELHTRSMGLRFGLYGGR